MWYLLLPWKSLQFSPDQSWLFLLVVCRFWCRSVVSVRYKTVLPVERRQVLVTMYSNWIKGICTSKIVKELQIDGFECFYFCVLFSIVGYLSWWFFYYWLSFFFDSIIFFLLSPPPPHKYWGLFWNHFIHLWFCPCVWSYLLRISWTTQPFF